MRIYFFTFLLFLSIISFGQKPEKNWQASALQKANTAEDITYLTTQEKQVIFYLNLVRLDPKLFSETYLKTYTDSTGIKNSYIKSLKKTLENSLPLAAFQPQNDLAMIAKTHAIKSGKENKTGHADFPERIKKVEKKYNNYLGENCDYGDHTALEIVMELLIDDGIKDLGHRKNILNPKYHNIGVSIQPHKRYINNCVIDFGG